MKKLLIFKKGAAVVREGSIHSIDIDGDTPEEVIEANSKNVKKYFKKEYEDVLREPKSA